MFYKIWNNILLLSMVDQCYMWPFIIIFNSIDFKQVFFHLFSMLFHSGFNVCYFLVIMAYPLPLTNKISHITSLYEIDVAWFLVWLKWWTFCSLFPHDYLYTNGQKFPILQKLVTIIKIQKWTIYKLILSFLSIANLFRNTSCAS